MKEIMTAFPLLSLIVMMIVAPASAQSSQVENSWTSKAPMHLARGGLGVAVVDNEIYAIGGGAEGGIVGTNEAYNITADSWTYKASMPTPRASFTAVVYQNKIYCIGGESAKAGFTTLNEVYDVATDTWATKTSLPTARTSLSANVVDGKIYAIGGIVPDSLAAPKFSSSTFNEVYDPANDSWTTRAPMPFASSSGASAVVDSKIYIVGGSGLAGSSIIQIYDPKTDTWKLGATPPSGIGYGAAGATSGLYAPKKIYFVYDGTQVYDPISDSWGFGADMPTKRLDVAVAMLNDTLYVIGGANVIYLGYNGPYGDSYRTIYSSIVEQYIPFGYGTVQPSPTINPTTSPLSEKSEPFFLRFLTLTVTVTSVLALIGVLSIVAYRKKIKSKQNSQSLL